MEKILVLLGSPRKNENTELLANSFVAGALEAGHEVEIIRLQNQNISACLGCNYCMKNQGKCVQKDDMQTIYEKFKNADVIVLATPLYFFNFSTQMKAVIDRFYAVLNGNRPHKQSVLLIAYGSQDSHEIDTLVAQYRMTASALNWENLGEIAAKGVLEKGEITNHHALAEAKALGKRTHQKE